MSLQAKEATLVERDNDNQTISEKRIIIDLVQIDDLLKVCCKIKAFTLVTSEQYYVDGYGFQLLQLYCYSYGKAIINFEI